MWRFFLPVEKIEEGRIYELPPEEGHHLAVVLRLRQGERINVFNGKGGEYLAEIETFGRKPVSVKVLQELAPSQAEAKSFVNLAIPLTDPDKLELIVEKATELGVGAIYLFQSTRSWTHYPAAELSVQKYERLRRKIIVAAKQCGRAILPQINKTLTLEGILRKFSTKEGCLRIFPWEKCSEPLLSEVLKKTDLNRFNEAIIVIGPEGGFEDKEAQEAEKLGFKVCSLGKRILRLETAVIVSLALILSAVSEI